MKLHPQLLVPSLLLTVNHPFILFREPQLEELWPSGSTERPLCRGAHSGALQADWLTAGQQARPGSSIPSVIPGARGRDFLPPKNF